MLMLIARRVTTSLVLVLISTFAIFILMSLVPGDPARTILGETATPEAIEQLREQLGLNQPLLVQYGQWLVSAVQGDLGTSIFSGEPVTKLLALRAGVTLSLMVGSTLVIAIIGIALGLASALRGGRLGAAIDALSLVGLALPSFWIAIVLVALFAVTIRIFPATGYVQPSSSLSGWALSLVLPVASLAIGGVTIVAKQMRESARDVLEREYVRVLRATGIAEWRIVLVHVLRNASVPDRDRHRHRRALGPRRRRLRRERVRPPRARHVWSPRRRSGTTCRSSSVWASSSRCS